MQICLVEWNCSNVWQNGTVVAGNVIKDIREFMCNQDKLGQLSTR